MNEKTPAADPASAPAAPPTPTPPPPPPPDAGAAGRTPLKDRVYGFRAVLAVAAAGVILGATAGTGITALAGHDDHHHGFDPAGIVPGRVPEGPGRGGPEMPG
jgi:hypothetical protein